MADGLTRQMPHSAEAEQAVIGSMLIDPGCVGEVIGAVKPEYFYSKVNRDIYETIFSMFNYSMEIDALTVLDQMRTNGVWTEQTMDYLRQIMDITPTAANVMAYVAIIRDMALLRQIAQTGDSISAMAYEGGDAKNILEAAEKRIYDIRSDRNIRGLEPISKVLVGVYGMLTEASKRDSSIPGLSTGLRDLDSFIMGLNKSDLILIAARPGMGKSSIAMNIAQYVAKETDKTVAVFSLEMSREQLAMRLLSSESFIDNKKLQTGRLSPDEWKKVSAAAASLSKTDLRINDNPSLSVADMNAQCRRISNLGLVIIDYLQLMQSAGGKQNYASENRQQVVSDISRMLKIMAKELNVPVICLSQLSRASETRQDKRPMLSDLRESGAIEQDADIVLALYRDDYYNKESENPNLAELLVLKNRRGETGRIYLQWVPEFTTYNSVDTRHAEEEF